jgi:O-succinylbenzoic acid--CoA ligase
MIAAWALVAGARRWSWQALDEEVSRWCSLLHARGVRRGDRVVALSGNRPELVFLIHAAWRMGVVWIPLNARLGAAELQPLAARAGARLVLAEDALRDRLSGADSLEALRAEETSVIPVALPPPSDAADAAVLFTSGTTGVPRAVRLTRANFLASARASAQNLGSTDAGWLLCMPLFHVGGLSMVLRTLLARAPLVLHPRFDAAEVLDSLRREQVAALSMVPTQLQWLLDASGTSPRLPPSLRAVLVGGGPAPASLLQRARAAGFPVLQTYGLTEACSQVATERPSEVDGTTAGAPLTGVEVRTSEGEIQVRGPTVTPGYLDDPSADARAFTPDGWLRTGDLGELDAQGRLRVLSRRLDLIVTGGENVYPAEVEAVLALHPAVADATVVPLPDALWGQTPVALWTPRAPELAGSALADWCRARLAGFKVPRQFIAVPEVPRNAAGKVDRVRARALASDLALQPEPPPPQGKCT